MTDKIDRRIKALRNMDTIIRMSCDEEQGPFVDWIALHVPDRATDQDLREYLEAKDGDAFYQGCCEFFARRVSEMLVQGQWSHNGHTMELFNDEAYSRGTLFDDLRSSVRTLAKYITDRELDLCKVYTDGVLDEYPDAREAMYDVTFNATVKELLKKRN